MVAVTQHSQRAGTFGYSHHLGDMDSSDYQFSWLFAEYANRTGAAATDDTDTVVLHVYHRGLQDGCDAGAEW